MPRIAFVQPPVSFDSDASRQLIAPLMQNAMGLLDTYATEVPRLRMQAEQQATDQAWQQKARARQEQEWSTHDAERQQAQAAQLEDRDWQKKSRARQEQEWSMRDAERKNDQSDRDRKADEAVASGLLTAIRPDAADYTGDNLPDLALPGSRRLGAAGGAVGAGRGGGKEYDQALWNISAKQVEERYPDFKIDTSGAAPVRVELTGPERDEVIAKRRDAMLNIYGKLPEYGKLLAAYGVDVGRIGNTMPTTGAEFAPDSMYRATAGADQPATIGTPGPSAGAPALSMGQPVLSPARREAALSWFDRAKAIPPDRRAQLGLDDNRLWEIYKLLGGGDAASAEAPVPAREVLDQSLPPVTMAPEPVPAQPVAQAPVAPPPIVVPEPGLQPQRLDEVDAAIANLVAEARLDTERSRSGQFDEIAATVPPPAGRLVDDIPRLEMVDAGRAMVNPTNVPWWLRGKTRPDPLMDAPPEERGNPRTGRAKVLAMPSAEVTPAKRSVLDWINDADQGIHNWYVSTGNR